MTKKYPSCLNAPALTFNAELRRNISLSLASNAMSFPLLKLQTAQKKTPTARSGHLFSKHGVESSFNPLRRRLDPLVCRRSTLAPPPHAPALRGARQPAHPRRAVGPPHEARPLRTQVHYATCARMSLFSVVFSPSIFAPIFNNPNRFHVHLLHCAT